MELLDSRFAVLPNRGSLAPILQLSYHLSDVLELLLRGPVPTGAELGRDGVQLWSNEGMQLAALERTRGDVLCDRSSYFVVDLQWQGDVDSGNAWLS